MKKGDPVPLEAPVEYGKAGKKQSTREGSWDEIGGKMRPLN